MRNKEKDAEWRKEHGRRLVADLPPVLVEQFKEKLKGEGKAYQAWLKEQIERYLRM